MLGSQLEELGRLGASRLSADDSDGLQLRLRRNHDQKGSQTELEINRFRADPSDRETTPERRSSDTKQGTDKA